MKSVPLARFPLAPPPGQWPLDSSSCRIADVKLGLEGLWILYMGYLATKGGQQPRWIRPWVMRMTMANWPWSNEVHNLMEVPAATKIKNQCMAKGRPGVRVGHHHYPAQEENQCGQRQSRRLHLTTVTILWPEQRCQILCIFCYFRLPWGNRKVPLARATLPIPLYFWLL